MAPRPVRVGVVLVNWNGAADTAASLESLAAADPGPARVVVVDNGSTDGSIDTLTGWRAGRSLPVTILASRTNRGFSGANNLGVAYLAPDPRLTHFLLLNNDATVHPTFFAELAGALDVAPDAGIVGPTIYEMGRPGEVWYAGGRFVPLRALVVHNYVIPDVPQPVPTEFVTGCAMLIARHAWDRLGPLPESYFIYMEDAEYSWRAQAAGLPVVYAPRAIAYHAVGAAIRRSYPSPRVAYWNARHRALFVRRNFQGWMRWGALGYLVMTKPVRALVEGLRGRPRLGWAVLRGTLAGLLAKDRDGVARERRPLEHALHGVVVYE